MTFLILHPVVFSVKFTKIMATVTHRSLTLTHLGDCFSLN